MAEFARWQWDDQGQWRDFSEQYQAEMEASFQSRADSIQMDIPPHGTFMMDLKQMQQVTVKGRIVGYSRDIRRQARKIEAGYFILGQEGNIYASDAAIDKIEADETLKAMEAVLARIVEDPEDFGRRSVNLEDEEYREALGMCEEAVEFMNERGFEEIEEGDARFLVFMQDDIGGLRDALQEVQARLAFVRKPMPAVASIGSSSSSTAPAPPSNEVPSNEVPSNEAPSNEVTSNEAPPSNEVPSNEAPSNEVTSNEVPSNEAPSNAQGSDDAPSGEAPSPAKSSKEAPSNEAADRTPARGEGGRFGSLSEGQDAGASPPCWSFASTVPGDLSCSPGRPWALKLVLPGGEERNLSLLEDTLEELLKEAAKASGFRLPIVRVIEDADAPVGLAVEPGVPLCRAARLVHDARLAVEDFEKTFVDTLAGGLLRLQDLAAVAPLLAWEKPELPRLLLGRLRSLLEGSCEAWCKAAGCSAESELSYGRALLRFLYADKPLEKRLEVIKQLLPVEKRDDKTLLKVKRKQFLRTALSGLQKLSAVQLRRQFAVQFEGEVAEDHGGPRRDFFGTFGARLLAELPALWKQLPRGALVPVADLVAELTPKSKMAGFGDAASVYRACGRACGLAARFGDVVGEEFAEFFLHQVARDDTVPLEELQKQLSHAEGPGDIRASQAVLSKPLVELGLQPTLSRIISHTQVEVELVPGGRDVEVTDDNKAEWLQLHLHNKLYGSLRKAADSFREGILDVFGGSRRTCPLLVLLSPSELARLWAGACVGPEQLRRWREVAVVSQEVQKQADWFWELLEEGDEELRGGILKFATGVHRIGGLGLQCFEVQPADGGDESLPGAMTCANMLQLPRYTTKAALDKQLRKAIELCDGFQVL